MFYQKKINYLGKQICVQHSFLITGSKNTLRKKCCSKKDNVFHLRRHAGATASNYRSLELPILWTVSRLHNRDSNWGGTP